MKIAHSLLSIIVIVFVISFCLVVSAQKVQALTGAAPSTTWTLPGNNYTNMQWTVRPETDPSPQGWFWANQWWIRHGDGQSSAGYAGLQTVGSGFGTKIAIFSIWDALGATVSNVSGSVCVNFGNEGTGYSCRIPYDWQVNHTYRFDVRKIDVQTWEAKVVDASTGVESTIGKIIVPSIWEGLGYQTVSWTERYSGVVNTCDDFNYSRVFFSEPVFDGGTVRPISSTSKINTQADCTHGKVTTMSDGVYQENGIKYALTGAYFNDQNFTQLFTTRLDSSINFNWGKFAPVSSMQSDKFTVRWTGKMQAPESNVYTFCSQYNDGVKLWLNGQLLINDWNIHNTLVETCGTIMLSSDHFYDVKLEYLEFNKNASVGLKYSTSNITSQIIPSALLRNE